MAKSAWNVSRHRGSEEEVLCRVEAWSIDLPMGIDVERTQRQFQRMIEIWKQMHVLLASLDEYEDNTQQENLKEEEKN